MFRPHDPCVPYSSRDLIRTGTVFPARARPAIALRPHAAIAVGQRADALPPGRAIGRRVRS